MKAEALQKIIDEAPSIWQQIILAAQREAEAKTIVKATEIAASGALYHPSDGSPVLTGEACNVAQQIAVAIRALPSAYPEPPKEAP